jgi:hypothetical protein
MQIDSMAYPCNHTVVLYVVEVFQILGFITSREVCIIRLSIITCLSCTEVINYGTLGEIEEHSGLFP